MKRVVSAMALSALLIPQPACGTEFLDRCFQDLCNCLCAPFTARRYEPATVAVAPPVVAAPAPVYQVPPAVPVPAPMVAAPAPVYAAPAPVYAAPAPTCASAPSCAAEPTCMPEAACCAMPQAAPQPVAWVTYEIPQPSWWQRFCECLCPPRTPAATQPAVASGCGAAPAAGGYAYDYAPPATYAYGGAPGGYAKPPVPSGYEPGMIDFQVVSDEPVGSSQVAEGAPERPAEFGPSVGDPSPRSVAERGAEVLPPPAEVRGIPVSH